MVNGIDELAVTNVDGLDSVETIKVCIGYRDGAKRYDYVPNDIEALSRCVPIYAEFPGWRTPTHNARKWKDLPAKTRSYLKALAELSDAKLAIASVGPGGSRRSLSNAVVPGPKRSTTAEMRCRCSGQHYYVIEALRSKATCITGRHAAVGGHRAGAAQTDPVA